MAFAILAAAAPAVCAGGDPAVTDVAADESVVLFPAQGRWIASEKAWEIEVRGCVYEAERRRLQLALLRRALALKRVHMSEVQESVFNDRARLFLADNERGRTVRVRLGDKTYPVGKSGPNGQFSGSIRLGEREAGGRDLLTMTVALPKGDQRVFASQVFLRRDAGAIVVSDIDDTIKLTSVGDRSEMLKRTFLEPFAPVPGMAAVYRAWETNSRVQFRYVSASPWQLFPPLMDFVRSNDFPVGTFHLKLFRWKDESFFSLLEDPETYKKRILEPMMTADPGRRFVLVGDSGERDPEIYASLAVAHPGQVAAIFIRDVGRGEENRERFERLSRALPPGLWQVFREPSELPAAIPSLGRSEAPGK